MLQIIFISLLTKYIFIDWKGKLKEKRAFPVAQPVKNPPAMQETQETQVPSLGGEDPQKETAIYSSILA